jgi:PPOX class probable F420-dependent enzyme
MTPDEVSAHLAGERTLNVATVGPDGDIHLVAMWYVLDDGDPVFWTYGTSQKIANLGRNDRITALVESGDSYGELRGVELVGRAEVITDRAEVLRIGRALAHKYGNDPDTVEAAGAKRVAVRMRVERVVSWDHRKLTS